MSKTGISVVICTHNGEKRIVPTLEYLTNQEDDGISWELLLIDNASTDNLERSVNRVWNSSIPVEIIAEEKIGLSYARLKGLEKAKYPYICFVDDDNLLAPDYIKLVHAFMESHTDAGAVGGLNLAPEHMEKPFWFSRYQGNFAIGPQSKAPGKLVNHNAFLWGAGMCIRKEAWQDLLDNNFVFLMTGRTGKKLLSGEDTEICCMLRLCGWNLYYDEQLRLVHQISSNRINWEYLCKLKRGLGASSVYMALYRNLLSIKFNQVPTITQPWWMEMIKDALKIISRPFSLAATLFGLYEGNDKIIQMHSLFGRLSMRVQLLSKFDRLKREMFNKYGHLLDDKDSTRNFNKTDRRKVS
ncbi:MAG: glycosyltransferase [Brevefilum fermentans]